MARKKSPFTGTWRITEMELWERDALDMVGPATLKIEAGGLGMLCFIAIEADIDARVGERDGTPRTPGPPTGPRE